MTFDKDKVEQLRLKRMRLAEAGEHQRVRASYGPKLALAISEAIKEPFLLKNFDEELADSIHFESPAKIWEASGLVASYVAKSTAVVLMSCFRLKIGKISGRIAFDDLRYLGMAELKDIGPEALLHVVDNTKETVLFFVNEPRGTIFIDYESSSGYEPFSVLVQGDGLVQSLASCFKSISFEKP